MVASLDGMIAKKDNSVSWFDTPDYCSKGVTVQDPAEFLKTIDCYVMGSRTYEHALELSKSYGWAYGDTPVIVMTHRKLPVDRPNVTLYSGSLNSLVNERLKPNYANVWVAGGSMLAKEFICLKLANEIRLSVVPIILGDGVPFFDQIGLEQPLHLEDVTGYKNGIAELIYAIRNSISAGQNADFKTSNMPSTIPALKKMSPQLLVADIQGSIEFYTQKLGFTLDFTYEDFYAGIVKDGHSIHLKSVAPSKSNVKNREDLDIIFSVDSIERLYEEMSNRSVDIIQPLRDMP